MIDTEQSESGHFFPFSQLLGACYPISPVKIQLMCSKPLEFHG